MIPESEKSSFIEDLNWSFSLILINQRRQFDIGGNAVIIGNNLAITCTHILLNNRFSAFDTLDFSALGSEYFFPETSLNIYTYSKRYNRMFLHNVKRVVSIAGSDLTIMFLQDHIGTIPEDSINAAVIDLAPPKIGEHVFSIGTILEQNVHEVIEHSLSFQPQYEGSFGEVLSFRAATHLLYTSLTARNTFSGSPVFNNRKRLIGLVSNSFGSDPPLTGVSLIYPLFTNKFFYENRNDFHMYNFATQGILTCENLNKVKINGNNVSVELPISYKE